LAAILATAALGVAFDDCPPVLEYTPVSSTSTLTLRLKPKRDPTHRNRCRKPAIATDDPDALFTSTSASLRVAGHLEIYHSPILF
jgi:hypothetical protein